MPAEADWATRVPISPGRPGPTPTPIPGVAIEYECGETHDCDLERFMERVDACALFVIKAGQPVLHMTAPGNSDCERIVTAERYGVASVTKSLTSLLFGQVMTDPAYGTPVDLDEQAYISLAKIGLDYRRSTATLRDLLNMSSGMKWSETETHKIRIEKDEAGNQVGPHRTLLEAAASRLKNEAFKRSKRFNYSGFDSLVLGMLVEHRLKTSPSLTTETLAGGLEHSFWNGIGMQRNAEWKADFDRHPPAYCCLYASAGDMAKLGYWVLEQYNDGARADAGPMARWVRASVEDNVATKRRNRCEFNDLTQKLRYGYQWWVLSGAKNGFTARGKRGQFLHIMPEFDVVVAQFGRWGGTWKPNRECESYFVHRKIAEKLAN